MLSQLIIFLLPIASFGALTGGYNYNRCDSAFGPANWPGMCQPGQTSGTPINLCGAVPFTGTAPTLVVNGYSTPRTMNIYSDGTSLTVNVVSNPPTMTAGTLSTIVGQTTNTTVQTWVLQQMHLHWGRNGKTNEGSEHYLQGQQYAAEAHFVHYNSRFADFTTAVGSGATDALLVVGVFLKSGGQDDSATITAMANAVATITKTPTAMTSTVTLSDLFDGSGNFYSYGGSLTTPTCLQIVTWVVIDTPKTVSMATMNKLWQASTSPKSSSMKFDAQASGELISLYGNYRPLQTIGTRTLYYSGTSSAACGTTKEADFGCSKSTGAGSVNTPAFQHLSILFLAFLAFCK